MNWSYKFEGESPEAVVVRIYYNHDSHVSLKHSLTVERESAGSRSGADEPVSRMFDRAHRKAQTYIKEAEEARQLKIEGNQRGEAGDLP